MLTGNRAARLDAVGQDFSRGGLRAVGLAGHPLVVADERVQVSVTGVKDVPDPETRPRLELADAPQDFRQTRARHDPVLDVVVRRDAAHRGERRLPALPDARTLRLVARDLDGGGVAPPANVFNGLEQRLHFRRGAVELDDQHRVGGRKPGMDGGLDRLDRQRIHDLHRGRHDARRDDVRDRLARAVDAIECREQRLHALGTPEDTHDRLRDDPERAFGSDDEPEQVGTRRRGARTFYVHQLAVRQHEIDAPARDGS